MPNDAKLGLVVGLGLVLLIGVVFFRGDLVVSAPAAIPATSVNSPSVQPELPIPEN